MSDTLNEKSATKVFGKIVGDSSFSRSSRKPDETLFGSAKQKPVEKIEQIERAADNENYQEFNTLINDIDLSCYNASEIVRIINSCLLMNAMSFAQKLTVKAKELFPTDLNIDRLSKVLSPPQITVGEPAQKLVEDFSYDVIKNCIHDLKGKWIAMNNGKVIGSESSLEQLMKSLPKDKIDNSTTVVKVMP